MNSVDVKIYSFNEIGITLINSAIATTSMTIDEILKLFNEVEIHNIYKIEIKAL